MKYQDINRELKRKTTKHIPRFALKSPGEKALIEKSLESRMPLMLEDIQYLLMSSLLGSGSPFKPERWCVLEKPNKLTQTVVMVIEGLSSYNFLSHESLFEKTKEIFQSQLEVNLPNFKKNQILEEISSVPITQSLREQLIKEYGSLEAAVNMNRNYNLVSKTGFTVSSSTTLSDDGQTELVEGETFARTLLLLSPLQMMIENYPMPLRGEFEDRFRGFRCTKQVYEPVTNRSPMFGLDCEMCRTKFGNNELTRVSIVDENFHSVYESLVRPEYAITDYLTPWSGITAEMMAEVTKTLKQVQDEVCALLPSDAILVGQSLNCDLIAMKLMHPYVIDTSCIFNLTGDRQRKSKLQQLAKDFLGVEIQMNTKGHNSIEDSTASLKLTKLKLSKDIYFGDVALQSRRTANERIMRPTGISQGVDPVKENHQITTSMLTNAMKASKNAAIFTANSCDFNLKKLYNQKNNSDDEPAGIVHHKEPSAEHVVKKAKKLIINHNFNLLHFNILEDQLFRDDSTSVNADNVGEIVPKIDKWISKIHNAMAPNGLFCVLFGGSEACKNGLTMVTVKH